MTFARRQTNRREAFEIARSLKMTVGEFFQWLGDRPLQEGWLAAAICGDLEMSLADVESRMTSREYEDWRLLYDVEAEAQSQSAENTRRRER